MSVLDVISACVDSRGTIVVRDTKMIGVAVRYNKRNICNNYRLFYYSCIMLCFNYYYYEIKNP